MFVLLLRRIRRLRHRGRSSDRVARRIDDRLWRAAPDEILADVLGLER